MVFENIIATQQLIPFLKDKYGVAFAVIPFMDCQPSTSYLVSEDGKHVVVGVDFCGYTKTKEISIREAGARSTNSKPAFKRRNRNGLQCNCTIPVAVYSAFILGEIPKFKLRHIDGNPNNCHKDNLALAVDSVTSQNLGMLATTYQLHYNRLVDLLKFRWQISREDAEDFVSDAFIRMLNSRSDIDPERASRLWYFFAEQRKMTFYSRNKIVYDIYDSVERLYELDCADEQLDVQRVLAFLPPNCREVVQLLMKGYDQHEIAKLLQVTPSWINALLRKTKQILKSYDIQG